MSRRVDSVEVGLLRALDQKPCARPVRRSSVIRGVETFLEGQRRVIASRAVEFLNGCVVAPDTVSHITSDDEAKMPPERPLYEFVTEDGIWRVVDTEILEELAKLLALGGIKLLRIRKKGYEEDEFEGKLVYRAPSMFIQEVTGRTTGRRHEISPERTHIMVKPNKEETAVSEGIAPVGVAPVGVPNVSRAESLQPVLGGRRRRYISGSIRRAADEEARITAEKEAKAEARRLDLNAKVRARYRKKRIAENGEFHEDMGEAIRFAFNLKLRTCINNFLNSVSAMTKEDIARNIEAFRGECRDEALAVVKFNERPTVSEKYMVIHRLARRVANGSVLGPTRSKYMNGNLLLRALSHQYNGVSLEQLHLLPFSFRFGSKDLFEIIEVTNAFLKRKKYNLRVHIRGDVVILGPCEAKWSRPKKGVIATEIVENKPKSSLVSAYLKKH